MYIALQGKVRRMRDSPFSKASGKPKLGAGGGGAGPSKLGAAKKPAAKPKASDSEVRLVAVPSARRLTPRCFLRTVVERITNTSACGTSSSCVKQ